MSVIENPRTDGQTDNSNAPGDRLILAGHLKRDLVLQNGTCHTRLGLITSSPCSDMYMRVVASNSGRSLSIGGSRDNYGHAGCEE